MEKNNIPSKGMRTLTQDEINNISGGFWNLIIPVIIASIAHSIIKITKHKEDPSSALHDNSNP